MKFPAVNDCSVAMKENVLILKQTTLMDLGVERYAIYNLLSNVPEKNYIEGEQMIKQMGQNVND